MKHSKIFRTLALIIILCLLLLAIPATPALAQAIYCSPSSGTPSTTVSVTGQVAGYVGPTSTVHIFFNSTQAGWGTISVTSGYITGSFTVPANATAAIATITVYHSTYGTPIAYDSFTVTAARQITISPSSGYVGSTVTVSGSGFDASSSVTIYFDTTVVGTVTATATGTFSGATFTVPESYRGTHTVKGSSASGDSTGVSFTTLQKITVTPTSGAAGDTVIISGTGFAASSGITLYFDTAIVSAGTTTTNANGSFTNNLFTIPSSSRGSHTIKAQDASGNYDTTPFTIAEKITITPTSGTSGTTVTVSGTGFSASRPITIQYNTVPVTTSPAAIYTDANGSFTTSFNVPTGAAGTYSVVATDGIYSTSASFTATTDATISQTTSEASPGYVNMELTITGTGFKPNATVTITYTTEPVVLKTVTADASGAFSVIITIPASIGGTHTITVTDGYTPKVFTFVMESQAPTIPAPLLPEEGIKAEAEAYFNWEDVDDPSGVTYTLWIASDADFTTIVLEKTGLASSEYTLTEEEKLESVGKEEPYYWRVKAIDGASNESQSEARSFYTGFQWPGFIGWPLYLVIGVGGVLLFLFGFWVGRRTAYF